MACHAGAGRGPRRVTLEREARPAMGCRAGHEITAGDGGSSAIVTDTADLPAQLRRRRAASRRLPVLDCGCGDPWHAGHLEASPRNIQAARAAWWHLREFGLLSEDSERVLAESARRAAA